MNSKHKLHQTNLAIWIARFKEQAESGLTIKAWCEQNDVSFHAYNYWKHLAKESYVDSIIPDIVPVSLPQSSDVLPEIPEQQALPLAPETTLYNSRDSRNPLEEHPSKAPSALSLTLGDIRIDIGSGASDDVISNIIKAVRHA